MKRKPPPPGFKSELDMYRCVVAVLVKWAGGKVNVPIEELKAVAGAGMVYGCLPEGIVFEVAIPKPRIEVVSSLN